MLPWSAPGYGQGIFPGQAPFPGPTSAAAIAEAIARDRERQQVQTQQAIQGVSAAISDAMRQRQNDAIASQLLAGSAPQAEAFTPAGEPTPTGTPSTSLSPEEAAQNKALGYPTTQLLSPTQTYTSSQELANQHLKDLAAAAHIDYLNRLGYGRTSTGSGGSATANRYVTVQDAQGRTIRVTGNEAAKLLTGGGGFSGAAEVARGWQKDDGTFTNKANEAGVSPDTPPTAVQIQFPRAKSLTVLPAGTWDAVKAGTGAGWKIVGTEGGSGGGQTANDARAVEWARAHPDDPRARQILAANGL